MSVCFCISLRPSLSLSLSCPLSLSLSAFSLSLLLSLSLSLSLSLTIALSLSLSLLLSLSLYLSLFFFIIYLSSYHTFDIWACLCLIAHLVSRVTSFFYHPCNSTASANPASCLALRTSLEPLKVLQTSPEEIECDHKTSTKIIELRESSSPNKCVVIIFFTHFYSDLNHYQIWIQELFYTHFCLPFFFFSSWDWIFTCTALNLFPLSLTSRW